MTDDELKVLVASLAIDQKELTQKMAQTEEQMKRNSEELNERFRQTEEQMEETAEQIKRTDKKLDRLGELIGNISNNQGDIAEEFFYQSFLQNPVLGGVRFDYVDRRLKNRIGQLQDAYDLVLVNGDTLAIIEVKTKAHESDLEKLVDKKLINFPKLFSTYRDYHYYAGVATLVTNESLIQKARELGLFLLTQQGDHAEVVQTGRLLQ